MQTWGLTDPGNIRQQNQDSYAIVPFGRDRVLMIVCDGMGGAKSGNVASSLAVEVFTDEVRRTQRPGMTPEKAAAIRAALQTITQAEEDRTAYSEAPANAFGELMAELFTVKADRWTPVLRQFGRSLGKLIYFMDAACDLEEDRKKGQYNPLTLLGVQSGADFRPQLTLLAGDAAEAFERLPIVQDAAILQNILYSGVWTRFEAAFRTKQEEPT